MTDPNAIGELLFRYVRGTATASEEELVRQWAQQSPGNQWLLAGLLDETGLSEKIKAFHPENRELLRNRILSKVLAEDARPEEVIEYKAPVRWLYKWRWLAAAALLVVAMASYFLQRTSTGKNEQAAITAATSIPDAPAGKEGALLTLDDGSILSIDVAKPGQIAQQGGDAVVLEKGQLKYEASGAGNAKVVWNTVSTPLARQFSVVLPDSTKVWLNAGSSVKYPTRFTGTERKVEVTGEVYFEVTHNKRLPFIAVINAETEVQVLGTHFNINAYFNEPAIRTTLLEGSIRLRKGSRTQLLKPGEQAVVKEGLVVEKVNTDQVMAWKEGYFNLDGVTIQEFFRQLSRWYAIEVELQGTLPDNQFRGEIYKGENLSNVLRFLEKSGFRFTTKNNGKTLVVAAK